MFEKIRSAAEKIHSKINIQPRVGIILGSGLGDFAEEVQEATILPYEDIPHFKKTTVEGHAGRLIIGKIEGVPVAVMQGRVHSYEGHSMEEVAFPTRVLGLLGIKKLILTNAAGGINLSFSQGDLALITDHINLMGINPLLGPNIKELGPRFPDMTYAWDPELRKLFEEAAAGLSYRLQKGVYCGLMGPTYETPSEIKMLRTLGADMVGMSTVPENIAANHMGMKVAGISCITNMGAGILKERLDHSHIQEAVKKVQHSFSALMHGFLKKLASKEI